jgi:hypothetical protein
MRIAHQEIGRPAKQSPYDEIMAIWARWMTLNDSNRSAGFSHPQDVKEFMRTGEAVHVMIENLPRIQWWAIYKARGITTSWMFPNSPIEDVLESAEKILSEKMHNHIALRSYFD